MSHKESIEGTTEPVPDKKRADQQRRHRLLAKDKGKDKKGQKAEEDGGWLFWGRSRVQTSTTETVAQESHANVNQTKKAGPKKKGKKKRTSTTTETSWTSASRETSYVSSSSTFANPINSTYEADQGPSTPRGTSAVPFRADRVESTSFVNSTSLFYPPPSPTSAYPWNVTHETAHVGSESPSSIMPSVVQRHHGPRVINVTIYPEGEITIINSFLIFITAFTYLFFEN